MHSISSDGNKHECDDRATKKPTKLSLEDCMYVLAMAHKIVERPRNIPSGLLEEVKDYLDHMLDVGAMKPSKSAWSNAVVFVQKKDGGLRFCINFRRLNAQTRKDAFPLPRIHNAIDAFSGSKYYMTVDLLSGFWQTPMEESS